MDKDGLKQQIRAARGKFAAMAATYALGVFNDNFFKQAVLLLAVAAGDVQMQGWVLVIFTLPFIVLAAPAGWLADRFAKRRIVIGSKGLELLAMLSGAVGICTGEWWRIFTMLAIMATQSTLFSPALNGSIPELYPAEFVTTANAFLRLFVTVSILAGVAAAGLALDRSGLGWWGLELGRLTVGGVVVAVAALGLILSFGVPSRPAADPAARFPWRGPLDTLRKLWSIRRDPLLALTIGASTFIWTLGSLQVLLINPLGLQQFRLGTAMTSYLIAAQLIGIAAGGLLSSRLAVGRRWYRVLGPAGMGLTALMLLMEAVPGLPAPAQLPALFGLFFTVGVSGGLFLIPVESFIQVRPAAAEKGAVLAATNFAVFSGILLSGPLSNLLNAHLRPTDSFGFLGLAALLATFLFTLAYRRIDGSCGLAARLLTQAGRLILRLRYRIEVRGMADIESRGKGGILFLPNHPALIDPVIVATELFWRFAPRTLADRDQVDLPVVRHFARAFGARPIPDPARYGDACRGEIERVIGECIEGLKNGENLLLYPAGRIYRQRFEDLGGNSAVETILRELPDVRVVLLRSRGLWGSSFSRAQRRAPRLDRGLLRGLGVILANGLLFTPRRPVTIELAEPADLPRSADRNTLNRYLESFYNQDAPPNTYVPYYFWERGGVRTVPEPAPRQVEGDLESVPAATRRIVLEHLRELTGISELAEDRQLARDLGLDSLARMELGVWLEQEFGFTMADGDALHTVGDVLLAACGHVAATGVGDLKPIPARWFESPGPRERVTVPPGETLTEVFLNQARRGPGRLILADQTSGVRSYRDMVLGILALQPSLRQLPGQYLGIMLPASLGAAVVYFATLFSGKIPVMVNWTVGARNLAHSLDLLGVRHVLTAGRLLAKLESQGLDLSGLRDRLLPLEEVGAGISKWRKLSALVRSRLSWRALERVRVPETAVVLFTSGSESLPKAVPLTHANLLANMRDVVGLVRLYPDDRLIGMLPPFHSFGIAVTLAMPVCAGIRVAYHPNPTEGGVLARLIDAYKISLLVGTPTFLGGIVRAAEDRQLATLRLVVSGAEKCPVQLFETVGRRWPGMVILEGYGITECSPVVSANDENCPRPGTIGRVLPSLRYAVVDLENGRRVAPGERGMLLVRGPSIFGGYLNYEGASPFVEFEGERWYRTGDLVVEGDGGVLTFTGRLKRFVKLGGEMISLPAIEEVLAKHYASDADDGPVLAVEGTPVESNPELVLFTTLALEREEASRRIREAGLSPLHHVRSVVRLETLPTLGTGKTDYRALRELLGKPSEGGSS